MRRLTIFTAAVIATSVVFAQTTPKPKPKPATPPKPAQTAPTKGAVQLPGDNGKLGTTYQLGRKDAELHFTLDAVEIAMRQTTVDDPIVAKKNERIAILRFTVQNPQKFDQALSWSSFKFTMISPDDENFPSNSYLYHPERHTRYDIQLKPAQKVKAYVAFPIYGKGPITKLMVQRTSDAPVLRYDLRDKAKFIASTLLGPTGDALDSALSEAGQTVNIGAIDLTVEKWTKEEADFGGYKVSPSQDHYTVTVNFSNPMLSPTRVSWNTFKPTLVDENGEEIPWRSDLVTMSSGTTITATMDPGATIRGRFVFTGPKGLKPKTLTLKSNESERSIKFNLP